MAKKRSYSKVRILEHELAEAKEFLKSDPRGKRLQAAEHSLVLLIKGELPRLKRFIFDASFDLRKISNPKEFEEIFNSDPKITELFKRSLPGAYMKPYFKRESIQFVLFYEEDLSASQASLYSDSFSRVIALTYASLGIDMSGASGKVLAEIKSENQTE